MGISTVFHPPVLITILVAVISQFCDAQGFAAMSVDFGSKFIKIGIVKPGIPLEIVLNKESRRKTPNVVYIRNGERVFGDPAMALSVRFPRNVYGNLNDLLAKNLEHPIAQQYANNYPHIKLGQHENRSTVVFPSDDTSYSVETLLAMILTNAKEATEAFAEQSVKDIVITVPSFFNQAERKAITVAAKIAKLNLLQLMNDGTAAGLNYGVFRRKEITEKSQRLMIYDMGASKTTATIVEYKLVKEKYSKEPKMTVIGVGFDRTLGGEMKTLRLRDLLIEKFRSNYKTETDITSNLRGMAKLYKEAERVKQVLSANGDHFAQIEALHEDHDMRVKVTRDEFNALIEDLEERIALPVYNALEMAGIGIDQVDQVVLMGAGTRVPKVQEILQSAIGSKEIGRFLNTDESIAMGALYQAAHLSKGFKVKAFHVDDLQIYPVQVDFISKQFNQVTNEGIEKSTQRTLFGYKSVFPSGKKIITFTSYTDDFNFVLTYGDLSHLNEKQKRELGSTQISEISVNGVRKALEDKHKIEDTEFKGIKAAFIIDASGIVRLEGAEAVIERKPKGVVESLTKTISGFFSGEGKKEEGEPSEEKRDTEGSDQEPNREDRSQSQDANNEKSDLKENDKEKRIDEKNDATTNGKPKKNETDIPALVKVKLSLTQKYLDVQPIGTEERKTSTKILEQFEKVERLRHERQAAENELEAFAFEASLLPDESEFVEYSSEEERVKLVEETNRVRSWLEDDTNPSTPTSEFTANLKKIKSIVVPIKKRIQETQSRPLAIEEIKKLIVSAEGLINISSNGTSLSKAVQDENDVLLQKLNSVKEWLLERSSVQDKLKKNENPVLKTEEINVKANVLRRTFEMYVKKVTKIADDELKAKKKAEREEKRKKDNLNKEKKKNASGDNVETVAEDKASESQASETENNDVHNEKKEDKPEDSKTEL